jgi:hypothetical protein
LGTGGAAATVAGLGEDFGFGGAGEGFGARASLGGCFRAAAVMRLVGRLTFRAGAFAARRAGWRLGTRFLAVFRVFAGLERFAFRGFRADFRLAVFFAARAPVVRVARRRAFGRRLVDAEVRFAFALAIRSSLTACR